MRPEERGRYCFECRTKVHDLSTMTEAEAERFLERTASQEVCVSYEHDDDGQVMFRAPAPAPIVPISRLRRPRTAAAALMGAGMAAALAACAPHGDPTAMVVHDEVQVFEAPSEVIPLGEHETTPTPPVAEDEPCDAPPEAAEVERPRIRGRRPIRRTPKQPRKMMGKKPSR